MDAREYRQLFKVEMFCTRIGEISDSSPPESFDLLELTDGAIFKDPVRRAKTSRFADGGNVSNGEAFC
jgi:hypothetical protein